MSRASDTSLRPVSFLKARIVQAILVMASAVIILPVAWSFFFLLLAGWFKTFGFSLTIAFFRPYQIYLPSFITACLMALVLGMRSASWGSISLRFTAISSIVMAAVFDICVRATKFLGPQYLENIGIDNESFFYWLSAWFCAGALFWLILNLSGLTDRYKEQERARLIDAAKLALVYAIYGPVLYVIITLRVMIGDSLGLLAARGTLSGEINTSGLMLVSLAVFCGVRKLRLAGDLTWRWLFSVTLAIAVCLWIIDSIFVSKSDWQQTGLYVLAVYIFTAISLTLVGGGLLLLMGVPFSGKRFETLILPSPRFYNGQRGFFALIVFAIFFIVAPPLWQSGTLLWRALLFSLPPVSFFTASLILAYLNAGIVFAGVIAVIAFFKRQITFNTIFVAALICAICGLFLPINYLGVNFGILFNTIGWSMLLLAPCSAFGWYILSCCKQVILSRG
ncbi:hypothetical protein [uncultured Bartonella sp.]|uniref:hypothetical protein n=1 Tax=uncultured Bartonella sp. TaxID=104108 RepID=UPI002620FEE1|nr:hypothetical protein [uncultured Bartonella sp.]